MDAADYCVDYLSGADGTRNKLMHGICGLESKKKSLAQIERGIFLQSFQAIRRAMMARSSMRRAV